MSWIDEAFEQLKLLFAAQSGRGVDAIHSIPEFRSQWEKRKGWMIPIFDKLGENGRIIASAKRGDEPIEKDDFNVAYGYMVDQMDVLCDNDKFCKVLTPNTSRGNMNHLSNVLYKMLTGIPYVDIIKNRLSIKVPDPAKPGKWLPEGTKVTKYVQSLVEHENYFWTVEYLRQYPRDEETIKTITEFVNISISHLISALKYENMKIAVSINPVDMLTSSSHTSGWRSCHNFINGEYKTGPISYLLDDVSAVAFAYEKIEQINDLVLAKPVTLPRKIWRQMVFFSKDGGVCLHSRQYPGENSLASKAARRITAQILSEYLGCEYKWTKSKTHASHGKNGHAFHYQDAISSTVVMKGFDVDKCEAIKIGRDNIPCIVCGDKNNSETCSRSTCKDCHRDTSCTHCGGRLDREADAIYWYNSQPYCERCWDDLFTVCACCDETIRNQDRIWVGGTYHEYICPDCLKNGDFFECEKCGETLHADDVFNVEDHYYCDENCAEMDGAVNCGCGTWTFDAKEIDGEKMCQDCYEQYLENKEEEGDGEEQQGEEEQRPAV